MASRRRLNTSGQVYIRHQCLLLLSLYANRVRLLPQAELTIPACAADCHLSSAFLVISRHTQ